MALKKPIGFDERLQHSIDLLKKSESLALRYFDKGYYLAFSGGKDSQALYYVASMAKVKFEAHYALTTLDPPELVYFIRNNYKNIIIDRPEMTFAQLCIKKKALPTMRIRFCCAVLKETKGAGTVTLTGVRRQESIKRSKRNEIEISNRKFTGNQLQFDQFTRDKEVEGVQCIKGKDKIIINPIISWSEADVWYFLNEIIKAKHCVLYDLGWRRIGCLFCPVASKKEIIRESEKYPKYKKLLFRIIQKLKDNGYLKQYPDLSVEEIYAWWISKKSIRQWYSENKLQGDLFKS